MTTKIIMISTMMTIMMTMIAMKIVMKTTMMAMIMMVIMTMNTMMIIMMTMIMIKDERKQDRMIKVIKNVPFYPRSLCYQPLHFNWVFCYTFIITEKYLHLY